jgi:hypothetical protein
MVFVIAMPLFSDTLSSVRFLLSGVIIADPSCWDVCSREWWGVAWLGYLGVMSTAAKRPSVYTTSTASGVARDSRPWAASGEHMVDLGRPVSPHVSSIAAKLLRSNHHAWSTYTHPRDTLSSGKPVMLHHVGTDRSHLPSPPCSDQTPVVRRVTFKGPEDSLQMYGWGRIRPKK